MHYVKQEISIQIQLSLKVKKKYYQFSSCSQLTLIKTEYYS